MSFREDAQSAVEWAARYLEEVGEYPVLAQVEPGWLRERLPAEPPDEPEPFAALLEDMDRLILPATTHWQHPRFFAYFPNTGSDPAILAELLTATLNQVGILWRTGPALAELEEHVTGWLAQLLGLPESWHGHIEDTASISTLTALAAARAAMPDRRIVVCSEHTHSSIDKAARILELELRRVPVDGEFRLRPDELDVDGACAVVATLGTTSTTSSDPLEAIADRVGDVWLHVDAAYAGSAWVCPEFRAAGIERADSLVVNPHKWMLTGMGCSCLWTPHVEEFRQAFSLTPEYLRTSEDVVSLSEVSIPLGRPFRALRLWAVLRCFGRSGLQAMIRDHVRLAELFEGWVRDEPGWELCAPRPFSVVCFRLEGSDEENERLLAAANASGEIFISHTKLDGRYVLRMAIGNARTTEADVRRAWDVLRREAAAL
ncbi:MAG TPA: pyridoxal-dependent decarboxylase [Gaiellaceae bacterium]|jgi:aromatic-L-amino-acid decarboxylase|nr:pyridoxal-dependent decarboxylase [Gaiellaceae bacterium]